MMGTGDVAGGHQRRALLGVAHGDDVGVAADGADGVGHALALGGGGAAGAEEKPSTLPAQLEHGALEAQAGAGGGLEEQGGQFFAVAGFAGIGGGMVDDVAAVRTSSMISSGDSCKMSMRWFIRFILLF